MFEEFSAGYWVGQLYVEQRDGEHAVLATEQHEGANEQVYTTGEGLERMDFPLVMKHDEHHFPGFGSADVPMDTLAVPDEVLEATRVDNPPTAKEVLIVKAERAGQGVAWCTPYTVFEPDYA